MNLRLMLVALLSLAAIPVTAAGKHASLEPSKPAVRTRQKRPVAAAPERQVSLPDRRQTLRQAARIATTIPDGQYRAASLALVAAQQRGAGDLTAAAVTFQEARKATELITSRGIREARLEDIAEVQAQAGDIDGAFRTLKLIRDPLHRDSTLFKISRAQAQAGQLAEARRTAARQRLYETEPAAEALALAYAHAGRIDEALGLADALEADDQAGVFTTVAGVQLQSGDRAAATEMFQRAYERAAAASIPVFRDHRFAQLAVALAGGGLHEEAVRAAERIAQPDERDLALVSIADVYAHTGAVSRAREVLARISTGASRAHGLALIAREQERGGDHSAAAATLAAARAAMGTTQVAVALVRIDVTGNLAYYELGRAQLALGDVAGARTSERALRSEEHRAALLKEVAEFLYRSGDKQVGGATFREARRAAVRIYKSPYDAKRGALLSAITTAQCRVGDQSAAWAACGALQEPVDQVSALLGFAAARK